MRLKRLELFGFKSFADRTLLDFEGDTLTGIVGPNGCGKSNVVDSLRWALGETRPTSMRGAGMTDVIFKGSASRPSMSVAEVTLVLGNEDGALEGHGAEASITRRLFKSGEGEYLIDGAKVRLKDVRDLLFDTGLGSRGYAVLEQGKIDAVLSANPVQRRAIFEEAAGISRYRQRRHEAELRLGRVQADLVRLEDVMGELRTRVRSLKIQAGKAERWIAARDEWTREKGRLVRHRLHASREHLERLTPEIEGLEASLARTREERAELEREAALGERERERVAAELETSSARDAEMAGELSALDERRSQLGLRAGSWRETAAEERERARERAGELEREGRELADMRAGAGELERAAEQAAHRSAQLGERLAGENRGYRALRKDLEQQNERVLVCLHERTAAQNRVRHLEASTGPARERLERAEKRLALVETSREGLASQAEAARAVAAEATRALERAEAERAEGARELEACERRLDERRAARAALELERARLESRAQSLLDRHEERRDLSRAARRMLDALEGEGSDLAGRLGGLLADHLRADTRLARSLDVVLADSALALVARDVGSARGLVDSLGEDEGQIRVVIPGALAERGASTPPPVEHEGVLAERIRCDESSRPLARALLGDVVVVADLDRALELVRRYPAWRAVTPAGELVDAAGLTGGERKVTQGAAGRRAAAEELSARAREIAGEVAGLEAEIEREARRGAELEAELARRETERGRRSEALAEAQAASRALDARLEDLEASHEGHAQEVGRLCEEIACIEGELGEARAAREAAEREFESENARLAELDEGRVRAEQSRDELARDEGRAQVERTRVEGELERVRQRIEERERRVSELRTEIDRAEDRAAALEQQALEGAEEAERIGAQCERGAAGRSALQERLEELRASEKRGARELERARGRMEELQGALERGGQRLGELRLAVQRHELAREECLRRAAEELGLDEDALTHGFEPEPELAESGAMGALEARVSELKGELERLGAVNTEAVTELLEVGGRLEFLERESGDLAGSRKKLAETIEKIDGESRRLFLEAFEEVRENFRGIFRRLFGGGRADIELEPGADVLEAGIEIVARPPGRELLSIALLSGGQRTMTALALLFAVFQARPSPFCVLDEVDAALDDANIDRFLGMLEDFRENTQFVVVTHNKGTMSACQRLYGITMETKGVSRHVSVELDEVDAFAPEAAGTVRPSAGGNGTNGRGNGVDRESGEPVVELRPRGGVATGAGEPSSIA